MDPLFCNSEFSYNATYDCFENKTPILILTEYFVPRKFYSFGTRNVTAHSEWLTPSYHYPTDIGIQTEINSTSAEIMVFVIINTIFDTAMYYTYSLRSKIIQELSTVSILWYWLLSLLQIVNQSVSIFNFEVIIT